MKLDDKVRGAIAAHNASDSLGAALADAERMADQYAAIKPTPYIVPIERFVGMPIECKSAREHVLAY
jgi:hypothetical protein